MDTEVLELLRDPDSGRPLLIDTSDGQTLIADGGADRYLIRQGVPVFICPDRVAYLNRKYMKMYDRLAPFYDFPYKIYNLFSRGGAGRVRLECLDKLEIKPGDKILEVSIGTGANLPYLPANTTCFGIDISWGMLKKCRRNLRKWNRQAHLFMGEAERLPFKDESFDVVFHWGGINFFNDKGLAISEMIRTAKPGTRISIIDETEKYARQSYEHTPGIRRFFQNRPAMIIPPTALVPGEMTEIEYEDFLNERLYRLTFRKP